MVGVPGKYKGCNTCRARRVKCDNERPLCRKCSDSGRECQGYERETIFIVGTVEDKGRCSSHPPRTIRSPKNTPSPPPMKSDDAATLLSPALPLRTAWDDLMSISNSGKNQQLRIVALCTPLDATIRRYSESNRVNKISLPPYTSGNCQPRFQNEEFWLKSQCQAHMPSNQEGILLYLYEHNASHAYMDSASWKDPVIQANSVKRLGARHFATFPAHHFFARVYRPSAITTALLNRKPTFCGDPEWVNAPWECHPKAPFDRLLDIVSQIPLLLQHLDHLLSLEPTVTRRLIAQDLLDKCLGVQDALEQWHVTLHQTIYYHSQPPYWTTSTQPDLQLPFMDAFSFPDQLTSLTFIYYWAVQVLFYPCIGLLTHTLFSPVVDACSQAQNYPEIPPHLNINPEAFGPSKARNIAVNVCRGLDAALAVSTQPDLLAFPVHVVDTLYRGLNAIAQTGEGTLELLWLDGFRGRMTVRGQTLAGAVMGRGFKDLAEW